MEFVGAPHNIASLPFGIAGLPALAFGSAPISMIVTFDRGQVYVQPFNQRLTKEEVASRLQTSADGVTHLIKKKLLHPCGHPSGNQQKFFESGQLYRSMQDPKWMTRVTDTLYEFSRARNEQCSGKSTRRQKNEKVETKKSAASSRS